VVYVLDDCERLHQEDIHVHLLSDSKLDAVDI